MNDIQKMIAAVTKIVILPLRNADNHPMQLLATEPRFVNLIDETGLMAGEWDVFIVL